MSSLSGSPSSDSQSYASAASATHDPVTAGCNTADANVARRLSRWAALQPNAIAIAEPAVFSWKAGQTVANDPAVAVARDYRLTSYRELDQQSDQIARGLLRWGVRPGMRMVMLVPFGAMFIRLTFALLKAGVVVVLIDPGMGRKHLVNCISQARPDGFVGIPKAQAIRTVLRRRFPQAVWNVTVGRRWFWGGKTLAAIQRLGASAEPQTATGTQRGLLPAVSLDNPAAIIFTTGSTGPPKGVLYTQQTFNAQVDLIQQRYDIQPGSRDLACFPLFGLYDNVMGVTTVIPDMDPTRPADVNPQRLWEAVQQWDIDQAFGSPALWHRVLNWCDATGQTFPSLRRVLSAGAPVPAGTLQRLRQVVHPEADIWTPYGATEALPLASIESRQVIAETGAATAQGRGVCVGSRFAGIDWKVIPIDDGPLDQIKQIQELPVGQIGELMVSGDVVTRHYEVRDDQNRLHKVHDGPRIWHRMGDVGYRDEQDQFWFCGRKAHRVCQQDQTWFSIPCEAIINQHPAVYRSALVGLGPRGNQQPVIIIEPHSNRRPVDDAATSQLLRELQTLAAQHPLTQQIEDFRIYPEKLPVDIRHNSKIFREQLSDWVQLRGKA